MARRKNLITSLIKIDNYLENNTEKILEENILTNLTRYPKRISSMFFYDEYGSRLFEEITKLPEYYLTRTEIPLIKKVAKNLCNQLNNVDIIEFGSGNCSKISILLDAIPKECRNTICYVPFDLSFAAVEKSAKTLLNNYPGIRIHGIVADFMTQLDLITRRSKKVICFLGSTIGNFSLDEAQDFLKKISETMGENDVLILGFDMVKSKRILETAYNDSKNITEKFNKNILSVVNEYIETDFDPDKFEHYAFYNERLNRIEMHLKAIKDIEINSPYLSDNLSIHKGETIHTENSYKFTEEQIKRLAFGADLTIQEIYTDKNNWFSLVQLTKNKEHINDGH